MTFFEDVPFYGPNPLLQEHVHHASVEDVKPNAHPIHVFDCSSSSSVAPPPSQLPKLVSPLSAYPLQIFSRHPRTLPPPKPLSALSSGIPSLIVFLFIPSISSLPFL